jgi:hypothetical protein
VTWTTLPLLVGLVALIGYALAARLRPGPARLTALGVVLALAAVAHLRLVDRDASGAVRIQAPQPHLSEYWHYYLGTKYFAELGYQGLYAAGVLADREDAPDRFVPDAPVRDLSTYRLVPRAELAARAPEVKARFSPARWQQFKDDAALIRDATRAEFWRERGYSVDHGYNATPLVTALLGGLAAQPWLETATFVALARWLDLYLLLLVAVVVAALEGAAAGLTLLFFLFANPLFDHAFVGGAYLRSPWLVCLALALLALRMGGRASAGVLLALSGWMRIFPLVVPALLLLRDAVPHDRRRRLRDSARLHGAFAASSLLILLATSAVPTPDGRNPWLAFADNMRLHAGTLGGNQIGLQVPFRYAPENDGPGDVVDPEWRSEGARLLRERRALYGLCAAALLALAFWSLRGVEGARVLLPGLLVLHAALPLAHYYWAVLGLVPLAVGWDRRIVSGLTLLCVGLSLTLLPVWMERAQDLRFSLLSLEVGAFLVFAVLSLQRTRRAGIAAVALAAGAWLACSGEGTQAGGTPDLVDGDTWRSRALGMSVEKPPGWEFRPGSSLKEDPPRTDDLERLWEILEKPALTPLVTVARSGAGGDGVVPRVNLHVIPMRPGESPWVLERWAAVGPVAMLNTNIGIRRKWPAYEEIEPPGPATISGMDAATVKISYEPEAGEDAGRPVVERRWHVRRGALFFYFEALGPKPLPPEIERGFEQIVASVKLDP